MINVFPNVGHSRAKEWRCCFGLHVRTATIMIGMWNLFFNILSMGLLAIIVRDPELIQELDNTDENFNVNNELEHEAPALPSPASKIHQQHAYRAYSIAYHDVDMNGLVGMCVIISTLMLIYGAIKYKPSHLLPFFCLQLFDFAVTTLSAASHLCYLRSIHNIITDNRKLPWRDELLKLSPQQLSIIALILYLSIIMLKAYTIGIVWRCYKYLTLRQHNLQSMLPYIIPDINCRQERDYNTLLPDYDEAIAQSMKQPPPPYYQVVLTGTSDQSAPISRLAIPQHTDNDNHLDDDTSNDPPPYEAENNTNEPSTSSATSAAVPVSAITTSVNAVVTNNAEENNNLSHANSARH